GLTPSAVPGLTSPANGAAPALSHASATYSQMQQLRDMSGPSAAPKAAPRPGSVSRPRPWKWLIVGGVGVLVLLTTIAALMNSGDPNAQANVLPPTTNTEPKNDA